MARSFTIVSGIVLAAASTAASAGFINFNSLANNTAVANQFAPEAVFTSGLPAGVSGTAAGLFGANSSYSTSFSPVTVLKVTDTDVGTYPSNPADQKVLHTFTDWLNETGNPVFTITFSQPVTSISIDVFGDTSGASVLAGVSGSSIVNFVKAGTSGRETISRTYTAAQGVTKVVVLPGAYGDWAAVDNISYTLVPGPGATALAALGGIFAVRRRR